MSLKDALLSNDAAAVADTVKAPAKMFTPTPNGGGGFANVSHEATTVQSPPLDAPAPPPDSGTVISPSEASTIPPSTNAPTAQINAPDSILAAPTGELDEMDKQRNLIYCQMVLILAEIGVSTSAQWISGEWDDNHRKMFSFSEGNKKTFATLWAENLNLSGVKKDPNTALGLMAAGMILPIYTKAFMIYSKKKKAKKEAELKPKPATKVVRKKAAPIKEDASIIPEDAFDRIKKRSDKAKTEPVKSPEDSVSDIMKTYTGEVKYVDIDQKGTAQIAVPIPNIDISKYQDPKEKKGVETRGRKKGSKINPDTGKLSYPEHEDAEYLYYEWGVKVRKK